MGLAARKILGKDVEKQDHPPRFLAATYWGHRTNVALIAGLLGMAMDDERIPHAFEVAKGWFGML